MPYRGDDAGWENHPMPWAAKASPRGLTFFALEQDRRVLCSANANRTRAEQPGEGFAFVAFGRALADTDPHGWYGASTVTSSAERSRLHERGSCFVTIGRRGSAVVNRLQQLPASAWRTAVIDTPQRFHQHLRYLDETVGRRDDAGPVRQVAVDGWGKERPTRVVSNNTEETARNLVIRYAGRNRLEDGLGRAVNFFHRDCLSRAVRRNVDGDAVMTVLANGC